MKKAPSTPGPESHPWELNPKPGAYEASALPIELGWLLVGHIILRTAKLASQRNHRKSITIHSQKYPRVRILNTWKRDLDFRGIAPTSVSAAQAGGAR